jgi:membrane-bound serine protease (ClpP class)
MSIALRARRNKVVTGVQCLIGEIGVAQSELTPNGKVFVHGERWDAVSTVPVATGEEVVVRHVDGLQLRVEPAKQHGPVPAIATQ